MFGRIAPRYDLLNHLLSMNIDRYWRARTVARVAAILARPGAQALDVCCGTGDLTLALLNRAAIRLVFGSDFCHPMLDSSAQSKRCHRPIVRSRRARSFPSPALRWTWSPSHSDFAI